MLEYRYLSPHPERVNPLQLKSSVSTAEGAHSQTCFSRSEKRTSPHLPTPALQGAVRCHTCMMGTPQSEPLLPKFSAQPKQHLEGLESQHLSTILDKVNRMTRNNPSSTVVNLYHQQDIQPAQTPWLCGDDSVKLQWLDLISNLNSSDSMILCLPLNLGQSELNPQALPC